jgi:alpha-galactosidase
MEFNRRARYVEDVPHGELGMKIAIIGAGSRCFGAGQIVDLFSCRELDGRGITLSLVDLDESALALMTQFATRLKEHTGSDIAVESSTDRRRALPGAKYVITAVARARMPLWEQDFRVPLAHGFRHVLGEDGGPGALFHALRSLNLILPICGDIEELCPRAKLFNFTNPEARVLHAIRHLTRVDATGFCHGVFSAEQALCRYLNATLDELEIVSAGMNHFYCILQVHDRKTGKDRLPEALTKARADSAAPPLFRKMAQVFGVFTFPSDDHIGEYLSFGSEFHGVKWHYGQECRKVSLQPPPSRWFEDYAQGRRPIDEKMLRPSGELAVPVICDIELDRGSERSAVNVLNSEGYIENLPLTAVVEVPARVDAKGIHPRKVGPIPEPFAAYMRTQFSIHDLLTEAYRQRSKQLLLQALLLDPCVNSIVEAEKLLEEMLDLQRDFLPSFA